MTSPIIDFIEARLKEDVEIAARAAKSANGNHRQWYVTDVERRSETTGLPRKQKAVVQGPRRDLVADCPHDITPEKSTHIARHDPARVLREVTAKRAILAEHSTFTSVWWPDDEAVEVGCCRTCSGDENDPDEAVQQPCKTLRHLAAAYSDHPDYREEWAASRP